MVLLISPNKDKFVFSVFSKASDFFCKLYGVQMLSTLTSANIYLGLWALRSVAPIFLALVPCMQSWAISSALFTIISDRPSTKLKKTKVYSVCKNCTNKLRDTLWTISYLSTIFDHF